MNRQHISIVVPVYNEEAFLRPCLDALMAQTVTPDSIYIVDNNSTDSSRAIAEEYKVVTILNEAKQGICAATKRGLDAAAHHSGILLRCDADSRPATDWVERVITTLSRDATIVAVTGPGTVYDTGPVRRKLFDTVYMRPYFYLVGLALGHAPLFGSNFGIRADAWRKISASTHLNMRQDIHDDIDISHHLDGTIHYDTALRMPISARPFRSLIKMWHRYVAGFRSLIIHWPEQAPWQRFMHRR